MNSGLLPWEADGWLGEAHAWIHTILESHHINRSGPIEQPHVRPWSTVLRVPTDDGIYFFKATALYLAYEPLLTDYLARLRPDLLPRLLAVNLQRGWMLMRDSGTPLRVFIRSERSLRRWREILPLYTGLQQETAARAGEILALGVLDRRLETLPAQFEGMLADQTSLLVGQPDGLRSADFHALCASVERFALMCTELRSSGIPECLHHDDFHDGNLFLDRERVIFTDWGESAFTHPFFSLVVMLRGASNSLDLAPQAPELDEMRGWYLEQWTRFAGISDLRRIARLAETLGLVNRALTWRRVIANLPDDLRARYALAVPDYLQEYIHELETLS